MSLLEELETFKKDAYSKISPDVLKDFMEATDELVATGIEGKALQKGDTIPSFELNDAQKDGCINSSELLKKGPLVISFYRGGWCPFCSLELRALQQHYAQMRKHGADLVAISGEKIEGANKAIEKNQLEFHVLSDPNYKTAKEFGLVFELIRNIANLYRLAFDLELKAVQDSDHYELPIPATYVVDQSGNIKFSYIDADHTKRLEPTKIIEVLKSL